MVVIPQNTAIGPPEAPSPKPPPKREGLLIALAVLLGAGLVLGGLVGFQRWRAGGDEVAIETADTEGSDAAGSTTTTAPSTAVDGSEESGESSEESAENAPESTMPERLPVESVPCPERYSEEICAAADFVQQIRGRPFKEFPNIELLDDGPFDAALLEDFEESRADLVEDERLMTSLGLLPVGTDLFETFRSLIEVGVVGFYDPDDGRLVVRGGDFDLYGQSILVHELVHAFDDQWFDLSREDFESDDAQYGYLAVIEGNASRVEELWRDQLSREEAEQLASQELSSLSPEDLDRMLSLPRILINLQISPYQDGERYVNGLVTQGGEAAVDERFADPPESSEQVLRPSAPQAELVVADVEAPPADGPVTSEGTVGELQLGFWLGQAAGTGWGGDSYVIWESDGQVCTRVDIVADTERDLDEMRSAADAWASGASDRRTIERVDTVDASLLRVTGCY